MSYRVFELKYPKGYTFLIGTKERTSRNRERIGRALAGAWDGIFEGTDIRYGRERWVPPYGFELVPDLTIPTGETELPRFQPGKFYIVFALLESETAVSEEEERETTDGILRAIRASLGKPYPGVEFPRIGLVTLYNCSINVLESENYAPMFGFVI